MVDTSDIQVGHRIIFQAFSPDEPRLEGNVLYTYDDPDQGRFLWVSVTGELLTHILYPGNLLFLERLKPKGLIPSSPRTYYPSVVAHKR